MIVIDGVEAFGGERAKEGSSQASKRVLSTLLNELDGVGQLKRADSARRSPSREGEVDSSGRERLQHDDNFDDFDDGVLVIACTSQPWDVDSALLR